MLPFFKRNHDASLGTPPGEETSTTEGGFGEEDGASAAADIPEEFTLQQLHDRAVIMALFEQVVSEKQVRHAWDIWRGLRLQGRKVPLWRVLLRDPEIHQDRVFRVAARANAFEEAKITEARALALFRDFAGALPGAQRARMFDLNVLPVDVGKDASGHAFFVFATHDPLRSEVVNLLQGLGLKRFELRYAPRLILTGLITHWHGHLKSTGDGAALPGAPLPDADLHLPHVDAPGSPSAAEADAQLEHTLLVGLFEGVLIEAVQRRETEICLFPGTEGQVRVYHRTQGRLQEWFSEENVSFDALGAFVREDILEGGDPQEGPCSGVISRRISNVSYRFGLSVRHVQDREGMRPERIIIRIQRHMH